MGSTVAYLVKNNSIPKINKYKIKTHIDIQRYNTNHINSYIYYKKLFNVNKDTSYNINLNINQNTKLNKYITNMIQLDNMNFYEVLSFKMIRIPLINCELTGFAIIKFLCLICIFIFLKKKYN